MRDADLFPLGSALRFIIICGNIYLPRGRISIPFCRKLFRVKLVGPDWLFGFSAGKVLLELMQ